MTAPRRIAFARLHRADGDGEAVVRVSLDGADAGALHRPDGADEWRADASLEALAGIGAGAFGNLAKAKRDVRRRLAHAAAWNGTTPALARGGRA